MAGHFILAKAKAAEGGIDRVFAHAARRRAHGWEEEPATPPEKVKLAEEDDGLRRERHAVLAAHLHLLGRDRPKTSVEIELRPLGCAQLAGPHERQGGEFQRQPRFRRSFIGLDGAEEPAESLGSMMAARWAGFGAVSAPLRAEVGSVSARAVATA